MRIFKTLKEDKPPPPPSYHINVHTTLLVFHLSVEQNIFLYIQPVSMQPLR
jgi:hypothetical protein